MKKVSYGEVASKNIAAPRARVWLAWVIWAGFLGASAAVATISVLVGRMPPLEIFRSQSASLIFAAVLLLVVTWWLVYARLLSSQSSLTSWRSAIVPGAPLLAGTLGPVLAIFGSAEVNHLFYYHIVSSGQSRAVLWLMIVLMAVLLLQRTQLELTRGGSYGAALGLALHRVRAPFITILLLSIGMLQALSYLNLLGNDFLRYWAIADAFLTGEGYPSTILNPGYVAGGMAQYLVDLPLFPITLAASFTLFGHTVAAAYMPVVLANILLPLAIYLLFLEVLQARVAAFSLTALIVFFPPMRFYVLNWPLPDALFFTLLMACSWLFVRIVTRAAGTRSWISFGLLAAAVALTRPEGLAYAGVYLVAAVSVTAGWRHRFLAVAAFLLPVGTFSLVSMTTFGTPWPGNLLGTLGVANAAGNWQMLSSTTLELFASSMRLSAQGVIAGSTLLLALSLIGSLPVLYPYRRVSLLMLPAWINLLSVAMVDPRVSGVHLWFDFFRHISYPLPLLVLAAWVAVSRGFSWIGPLSLRKMGMVAANALLVVGVLWCMHFLTKPNLTFGADAGNLIGEERINYVDLLAHPFELPILQFDLIEDHTVPSTRSQFLSNYPDPVLSFYSQYDPVTRSAGVPYQHSSLYAYLAALIILLSSAMSPVAADASRWRRSEGRKGWPEPSH